MLRDQSIYVGETRIKVTDILDLLARGNNFERILDLYPELTYSDIMGAIAISADLIKNNLIIGDTISVQTSIAVKVVAGRLVDLESIRKVHPRAYEKWSDDEELQLRQLYEADNRVGEISRILKRQPGAIKARLQKLELME